MSQLNYTNDFAALIGQPEDWNKVQTSFNEIRTVVNALDGVNLSDALGAILGVNGDTEVRRGKSIIATEEVRTNVAYGTLTTPDQVSSVVLPTDGLIVVAFQALWKSSVGAAGRAAIHIGANQLKVPNVAGGAPLVQEATSHGTASRYSPLGTLPGGLATGDASGADSGTPVTTGQALILDSASTHLGGGCYIFAAAGTYTISVQFKSTSGSVTVKERKLWVWTLGF